MNRTTAFLAIAGALLLTAVLLGMPRAKTNDTPPPPPPPVVVKDPPVLPPPPVVPGSLSLTGSLSHPYLVPGTSDVFANLQVSAVDVPGSTRAPVNLALVIDRSGSMAGAKIVHARQAATRLVELLDEHDRISIVHYGTGVEAMGGVFATPENKVKLKRYIAGISEEGGTNIGEGLTVGARHIAKAQTDFRVNRLLLLSDGQPTVGLTSSQGLSQVVKRIRDQGVSVTSLGVGADFNEDLMQKLADVGGGSYGFINNYADMTALFQKDLEQAGTMVARNVTLTFQEPLGVHCVEVFGRPFARLGSSISVTFPDFSARQVEKMVVRFTASPSARAGTVDIAQFSLSYTDLLTEKTADARLSLAALMTDDTTLALGSRNKDAVLAAGKAQAAMNYQKAAEEVQRGDFDGARRTLEKNDAVFADTEIVTGREALNEERQVNQGLFGLTIAAPSAAPATVETSVKEMKAKSLRATGRGDSVY